MIFGKRYPKDVWFGVTNRTLIQSCSAIISQGAAGKLVSNVSEETLIDCLLHASNLHTLGVEPRTVDFNVLSWCNYLENENISYVFSDDRIKNLKWPVEISTSLRNVVYSDLFLVYSSSRGDCNTIALEALAPLYELQFGHSPDLSKIKQIASISDISADEHKLMILSLVVGIGLLYLSTDRQKRREKMNEYQQDLGLNVCIDFARYLFAQPDFDYATWIESQ